MSNLKKSFTLYLYFFKIGWFTFGGGWSIVAQMQKDYVENRNVLSAEELLDMVSVARSLPGTMIGNVAYLFGYHQAGIAGGVLSVLGIISPPLLILSLLTLCYANIKDNHLAAKALSGVRACVAPIIFTAVQKLHKTAFPEKFCYLIFGIACVLSLFFHVNCIFIILFGILCGLLFGKTKNFEKKEEVPKA